MVTTGPYVDGNQSPEVHDGQTVRVNRTASLLRNEVVHDAQEARSQEETYRVVTPPPLDHGINGARPDRVSFGQGNRDNQVVTNVQNRNHDHECSEEPVGNVDVAFFTDSNGTQEVHNISYPHQSHQNIDRPFQLSVFLSRGDTQRQRDGCGQDNQLPTPEGEGRQSV